MDRHSVEVEPKILLRSVLRLCVVRKHELEPGGLTTWKHRFAVGKPRCGYEGQSGFNVASDSQEQSEDKLRTLLSS